MSRSLFALVPGIDTSAAANDVTIRVVFEPSTFSSTAACSRIWVKFGYGGSAGSADYTIGKAYWGKSARETGGNDYDFAETPTQIFFSGSPGTTVTADTVSDELDFTYVTGATYVLSVYLSAGTNYKHSDATTWTASSFTHASSGDYAADLTWTGSPSEESGKLCFAEDVVENDYLVYSANLFYLNSSATTPPSAFATLPDLQISAEAYGHSMFTEEAAKLSFPIIYATSGERCYLEQTLSVMECSGTLGAQTEVTLKLPYLEIEATGVIGSGATLSEVLGFPTLVTGMGWRMEVTELPAMSLEISAQVPVTVGLDQSLPPFQLIAEADVFRADLTKPLFFPDFTAFMLGLTDGVSEILGFPELTATGRAEYMTVDADLFRLDLAGSIQSDANGVAEVLGMLEISATGHADYITVDANLFRLALTASMVGLTDGLDLNLIFPNLTAQGGRAIWTDAIMPQIEITAQAGERADLARNLPQLEITATAYHITVGVDQPLFALQISASGYTGNATLDQNLPWVRLDATAISGFAAILDQILPSPTLSATVTLTPLMWLDAELAPALMDSQANGADDGIVPGGVLADLSRWSVTVLRHSRW